MRRITIAMNKSNWQPLRLRRIANCCDEQEQQDAPAKGQGHPGASIGRSCSRTPYPMTADSSDLSESLTEVAKAKGILKLLLVALVALGHHLRLRQGLKMAGSTEAMNKSFWTPQPKDKVSRKLLLVASVARTLPLDAF